MIEAAAQPPPPSTPREVALRGGNWLGLQALVTRGLQISGQLALAWLLSPEDFGAIGLAYTVSTIANVVANSGLDDILIQRQHRLAEWSTPAFWISLTSGALGGGTMLAAAPLAARLYNLNITGLIAVLALTAPITSLSVVPTAILRASLRFRAGALIGVAETVLQQGLAIWLAYKGFGAYSFVLPTLVTALAKTMTLWLLVRPTIAFGLEFERWSSILRDCGAILGFRLLITAVYQGDYFVLGLTASSAIVGVYYFAFIVAAQIRTLAGNVAAVLFPTLMLLSHDPVRQGEATLRACRFLLVVVMPVCFLQAALAGPAFHLFFGDKWNAAIPLVQVLSIGIGFDIPGGIVMALLQARGQFSQILRYSCWATPFFFGLVALGAQLGSAFGVAVGFTVYHVLLGPLYVFSVLRAEGISWRRVMGIYLVPVTLGTASVGCAASLAMVMPDLDIVRILFVTVIASMLYIPWSRHFDPESSALLIDLFASARNRVRS